MNIEAALDVVIADLARHIDEDYEVAAGLVVMDAGSVAARHGIPQEDIVEYTIDYAVQAAI